VPVRFVTALPSAVRTVSRSPDLAPTTTICSNAAEVVNAAAVVATVVVVVATDVGGALVVDAAAVVEVGASLLDEHALATNATEPSNANSRRMGREYPDAPIWADAQL
jgi:hypothetical protein